MEDDGYMETIEMLAATMAHEVKNPLALIQANVDFIELCDKEKKHSANYRVIKEELRKTNEMLRDFIGLLKVAYRFDEEVDICGVVSDVAEHYRQLAGENAVININRPDSPLALRGSAQLLNIALSNVVKNAVEATIGSGTIDISVASDGATALVTVKDDGGGLSAEALASIRAKQAFTTKTYGSGIGVNICRNIIDEHKGAFDIKNAAEGGCVVTITLPKGG